MPETLYTQADVDAAIAGAVKPLNDKIVTLQAQVVKLSGPIAPPQPVGSGGKGGGPAEPPDPVSPGGTAP